MLNNQPVNTCYYFLDYLVSVAKKKPDEKSEIVVGGITAFIARKMVVGEESGINRIEENNRLDLDTITAMKVRKTTRRGGWIVFLDTSSFTFYITVLRFRVWSSSESEWVQSLCAADKVKNRRRKNINSYTGSFHKPEVVLSSLHFQGEFH